MQGRRSESADPESEPSAPAARAADLVWLSLPSAFDDGRREQSVQVGETYCLLGGAGSGKTTYLRHLLGLGGVEAGKCRVCGVDPAVDPVAARQRVSAVVGRAALNGSMTVRQNIVFFTRLHTPGAACSRERVLDAGRLMGVPDPAIELRARHAPRALQLSVWLAIAWLRETPVLLFDDPTLGLDAYASTYLRQYLEHFKRRGSAVLIATSDVLFASQAADRVGVIKGGRLTAERTRAQVLGISLAELHLDYVGRAPVNLDAQPHEGMALL